MRIYLCHISSCVDIFSIYIFIFYFYFPFIYLSRICIYILCVRVCVCARVYVISQFQGNISASRENKIYNRNKVESKNKIHDVEMKFIRKLRIAKAPAETRLVAKNVTRRVINVLSLRLSLEVTIRYEISQRHVRVHSRRRKITFN